MVYDIVSIGFHNVSNKQRQDIPQKCSLILNGGGPRSVKYKASYVCNFSEAKAASFLA